MAQMKPPQEHATEHPQGPTQAVVLDTNVALDWLHFNDPGAHAFGQAILACRVQWLACPAMRAEFAHVVHREDIPALRGADANALLAGWDGTAQIRPDPGTRAGPGLLCTDSDDQVFIDLALEHRCGWLLTHDKALLRLARRARARCGLVICPPRQFTLMSLAAAEPHL